MKRNGRAGGGRERCCPIQSLLLVLATLTGIAEIPESRAAETIIGSGRYSEAGADICLECHGEALGDGVEKIFHTRHGVKADRRTPMGMVQCETCHGGAAEHAEDPERFAPPVTFGNGRSDTFSQNSACLQCHDDSGRMDWSAGAHGRNKVGCVSCHTLHVTGDPILKGPGQVARCTECHKRVRADLLKPSRHPLDSGVSTCADCHDPHGSKTAHMLNQPTVNQTCYQCHAEKRGPYLWEHAPVRENCNNCHQPHGSNQTALLRTRTPYLCQQCHSVAGHPSTALGPDSLSAGDYRNRFVMVRGCLNCHSQVHGSNHPSGVKFNR